MSLLLRFLRKKTRKKRKRSGLTLTEVWWLEAYLHRTLPIINKAASQTGCKTVVVKPAVLLIADIVCGLPGLLGPGVERTETCFTEGPRTSCGRTGGSWRCLLGFWPPVSAWAAALFSAGLSRCCPAGLGLCPGRLRDRQQIQLW